MLTSENLKNNIWIINLDKSKDRMNKINDNFNKHGIEYNRFSAIYGKNVSAEYMNDNVNFMCKKFLCNYGMIGCAASHKLLWNQLINSDEDFYVIFEDDIEINEKTFDIIKKIIPYLENKKYDIDYLNLNCVNYGCFIPKIEFTIDEYGFGKPIMPFQTGSYIITKQGAKKLLKYISSTSFHVDFEILFIKFFSEFNYYTSNLSIVNLTNDETTIGTKRNSLILNFLESVNLKYLAWFLNVPIFTINLFYEINIFIIILLLLFVLNKHKMNSDIFLWFILLELFLVNSIYL